MVSNSIGEYDLKKNASIINFKSGKSNFINETYKREICFYCSWNNVKNKYFTFQTKKTRQ